MYQANALELVAPTLRVEAQSVSCLASIEGLSCDNRGTGLERSEECKLPDH